MSWLKYYLIGATTTIALFFIPHSYVMCEEEQHHSALASIFYKKIVELDAATTNEIRYQTLSDLQVFLNHSDRKNYIEINDNSIIRLAEYVKREDVAVSRLSISILLQLGDRSKAALPTLQEAKEYFMERISTDDDSPVPYYYGPFARPTGQPESFKYYVLADALCSVFDRIGKEPLKQCQKNLFDKWRSRHSAHNGGVRCVTASTFDYCW